MNRQLLQHKIDAARTVDAAPMGYPRHVPLSSMVYLMCRFDRAAARGLLPEGIEPHGEVTGPLVFQSNRAVGPLSAHVQFYACIEVEGHDSPDGTPGHFEVAAHVSPFLVDAYRSAYNDRARPGTLSIAREGDVRRGTAWIGDEVICEATVRGHGEAPHHAGFTNYLAGNGSGGVSLYTVMCDYRARAADMVHFEIGPAAPGWLRDLRPEPIFAWSVDTLSYTMGEVRELGAAASEIEARHSDLALLRIFSKMGRPAVIADADGTLLDANPAARSILGPDLLDGRPLRLGEPGERQALLTAIAAAVRSKDVASDPLRLSRAGGEPPLVARVLPIALRRAAALVMLTDPLAPAGEGPAEALRLLGLTEWEARIGQAVGQGLSPQEVAHGLGLTIATTRSALKVIFGKLGINRQAELACLVTRLGGL